MCCPFFSATITEKIIGLKGKYRLVVKKDGSVQITYEDEVYIPDGSQMISWKDVFEDNNPYFIGARIQALHGRAVELTVAVMERGACASHTVMFYPKINRTP